MIPLLLTLGLLGLAGAGGALVAMLEAMEQHERQMPPRVRVPAIDRRLIGRARWQWERDCVISFTPHTHCADEQACTDELARQTTHTS